MKSINRWQLIRTRTALYAAAVTLVGSALAGSALAAGPAQAAQPAPDGEVCVLILPGELLKCFASPEEANEFVGDAQVGPPRGASTGPSTGLAADSAGRSTAQILTLITKAFDLPFFLGSQLWVYGTAGPCSLTFNDVDYQLGNLGGWDNRISSYMTFSICWLGGYDFVSFGGAFRGYAPSTAVLGGGWDNDISSLRWT
jgi:hypothetical protein